METFFNINYEFDKEQVFNHIDSRLNLNEDGYNGYICVADGVIVNTVHRDSEYREVINKSMFSICDSGFIPLYIKLIHGIRREQYCGSDIFIDVILKKKYKMAFLGSSSVVLDALRNNISRIDERISKMLFHELPFCEIGNFNYRQIAEMLNEYRPDIIWISLGAPKQEIFMNRLNPYLDRGVMIAVGAVFKFHSGIDVKRAPKWIIKLHLEFVYRILKEPKKQIRRCLWIVYMLPQMLYNEWRRKQKQPARC